MAPILLWFRQDLRLADHPALQAALATGAPIVPIYLWAPEDEGDWPPGAASRWWLHHSLAVLDRELRARGSQLTLARGPAADILPGMAREIGAEQAYCTRRYEPAARETERRAGRSLRNVGCELRAFGGSLLFEPDEVRTREGNAFQVFTPFWRNCLSLDPPDEPLGGSGRLPAPSTWPESLDLAELELLPKIDWAGGLRETWTPGELGAKARLDALSEHQLSGYMERRNVPSVEGTSRLSPHLHFGEVSPRQIWYRCRDDAGALTPAGKSSGADGFLRELGWREFAHHLLHHFPHTPNAPLREEFARFPWSNDRDSERAWQKGLTGFPVVDAGMRQLWQSGWMHNRVRMIAASFLVKDLMIPWQHGARWFWDTLVDADLANNTLGWQWTSGCGADAAPYFRVFNPTTQGRKFDPDGEYVRRWVPELAELDASSVHEPTLAPPMMLAAASLTLGEDYPRPIVDHANARSRALTAFASLR